jgi:hypothetical protein
MFKKQIIALHGLPGAGKDTAADYLVRDHGFLKVAFADALYRDVAAMFCTTVEHLRDRTVKLEPQELLSLYNCAHQDYRGYMVKSRKQDLMSPRTSRYHLDSYGTNYMRKIDRPLWWVAQAMKTISANPDRNIVIPDLRYHEDQKEYRVLRRYATDAQASLCVVNITRDGLPDPGPHEIHKPLPPYLVDVYLHNVEGKQEDLGRKAYETASFYFAQQRKEK